MKKEVGYKDAKLLKLNEWFLFLVDSVERDDAVLLPEALVAADGRPLKHVLHISNNRSERSMEVKFLGLFGQTDTPTDRRTDGFH